MAGPSEQDHKPSPRTPDTRKNHGLVILRFTHIWGQLIGVIGRGTDWKMTADLFPEGWWLQAVDECVLTGFVFRPPTIGKGKSVSISPTNQRLFDFRWISDIYIYNYIHVTGLLLLLFSNKPTFSWWVHIVPVCFPGMQKQLGTWLFEINTIKNKAQSQPVVTYLLNIPLYTWLNQELVVKCVSCFPDISLKYCRLSSFSPPVFAFVPPPTRNLDLPSVFFQLANNPPESWPFIS